MRDILVSCVAILGVVASLWGQTAPDAQRLPVADAPAPNAPPAQWSKAVTVLDHDFEAALDGAYPAGWQSWLTESRTSFLKVRRTRGGGRVLQASGRLGFRFDLDSTLRGGKLRLVFDLLMLSGPQGSFTLYLNERRPAPDLGWNEAYESGPVLYFNWPKDSPDQINLRAPVPGQKDAQTNLGSVRARQWSRIEIVADLETNRSQILIDGRVQAADVPFADRKWFAGADRLYLDLGGADVLLDNLQLLHQTKDSEVAAPDAPTPAARIIPAQRLESAPRLDGVLDDPAWKQAWHTDEFYHLGGGPWFKRFRIEAWLGVTSDALFLATRIWPVEVPGFPYTKDFVDPRQKLGLKAVELQLYPAQGRSYGSALFLTYTGEGKYEQHREGGIPWNPDWQIATKGYDDHWIAEVRVPLVELTVGGVSQRDWGINLYVDRSRGTSAPKAILWPHVGGPNTSSRFALFTNVGAATELMPTCRLELPRFALTGVVTGRVTVANMASVAGKRMDVQVVVEHADGSRVVANKTFAATGDRADVEVQVPAVRSGDCHFQAHLRSADDVDSEPLAMSVRHMLTVLRSGSIKARPQFNYFTSETAGRIRCEFLGEPVPPGSSSQVTVEQGDRKITEASNAVQDSPFVVEFPLKGVAAGPFTARIILSDSDGARLAETTVPLVRRVARHNEVKIRWDNVTTVGGKPFFPIIFWGHRPVMAHQMGANVLITSRDTLSRDNGEQIRYMRQHGVHLIMKDLMWPRMYLNAGVDKTFWADPGKFLGPFADDITLLGYFVEDEPGVEDGRPSPSIVNHAEALRKMDPYHPTFISNSIGWDRFYAYAPVTEAVGAHIYPAWMRYNERLVADATIMLRRASHDEKPVWMTVQAFYFRNNRVHPTASELRHQIYSAIVHGAHGIGFWGVGDRPGFPDEDIRGTSSVRSLWQQLKKTLPAVRRLSPVLTTSESAPDGVGIDNDDVAILTRRHKGRLYVWLLNMLKDRTRTVLTLPTKHGELVNEIHPGGAHRVSGGRCELTLEPLQPMVLAMPN